MTQLTIRGVPDEVVDALREEASERRASMNAVIRDALSEHVEQRQRRAKLRRQMHEMDAVRARIRGRVGHDLSDSTPLIREDRDR